ncbi:intracellular protein transport protein USO1-like [Notolabrus celidotus]|uniref:intracellular protein transport protein USO1-like n=1 Tax=Notolabrus celidotus TaxID=1203425 RepID=UPI00148FB1D0|nr:intracellular protein transport protein USO1-like [Notolabrus celidotus]
MESEVRGENEKLQESVKQQMEIKKEQVQVSNLLNDEARAQGKDETFTREFGEKENGLTVKKEAAGHDLLTQGTNTSSVLIPEQDAEYQDERKQRTKLSRRLQDKEQDLNTEEAEVACLKTLYKASQAENENLLDRVSQLEWEAKKKMTEHQKSLAVVYELEKSKTSMLKKEKNYIAELEQLKNQIEVKEAKAKNLSSEIKDLEESERSLLKKEKNYIAGFEKLKYQIEVKEAKAKNLWSEMNDLEESERTLSKKEKKYMIQLEKLEYQNGVKNLLSEMNDLQDTNTKMARENGRLTDELACQKCDECERQQTRIEKLESTIFDLNSQIADDKELLRDKHEISEKLNHVESLVEKERSESQSLRLALLDFELNDKRSIQQNNSLLDVLDKFMYESETLKKTVRELQQEQVRDKNAILSKEQPTERQDREKEEQRDKGHQDILTNTDIIQSSRKDLDDENLSIPSDDTFYDCRTDLSDDDFESVSSEETFYDCRTDLSDDDFESVSSEETFYDCRTDLSDDDFESVSSEETFYDCRTDLSDDDFESVSSEETFYDYRTDLSDDDFESVSSEETFYDYRTDLSDDNFKSVSSEETFYDYRTDLSDDDFESVSSEETFYDCRTDLSDDDFKSTSSDDSLYTHRGSLSDIESIESLPEIPAQTRSTCGCLVKVVKITAWFLFGQLSSYIFYEAVACLFAITNSFYSYNSLYDLIERYCTFDQTLPRAF